MARPPSKLSPRMVERIKAGRRTGETYGALAQQFAVSVGTIANALKQPDPKPRAPLAVGPSDVDADDTDGEDLTFSDLEDEGSHEDMKRFLTQQINQTKRDMLAAEPSARGTMGRTLAQLMTLLARHNPPPPPDMNEHPDMLALAESVMSRPNMYVDQATRLAGPPCPACGRPTPPPSEALDGA